MATLIQPKRKWLVQKHAKGEVAQTANHAGSKHSKRHDRAYGLPGTANGVCIKASTTGKQQTTRCECGGCGARRQS